MLRELHALLPHADLLLLADQARCPYGERSRADLIAIAQSNTRLLLSYGARLIIVACNTASAVALDALRQSFPAISFVGMVPALKPAARTTRSGVVGVLATPATIAGGLLAAVAARWAADLQVIFQPCPGLVEQIEAGALDDAATSALLRELLAPLQQAGADTVVLGCTHYPYVQPTIARIMGPQVTIHDAARATAQHAANLLPPDSGTNIGRVRYLTTGDAAHLVRQIAQLGLPAGPVAHVAVPS